MTNLSEHAYSELKRKIISGEYAPGTKMREEHLAKEMNVSRTPVRAALSRLVDEKLLVLKGRTPVIASWASWDILEVFELRIMLEAHGAGLAAERASQQELDAMHALNEKMQAAIDDDLDAEARILRIQEINNDFHHCVLDASHSGRLKEMLNTYLDVPMIVGSFYFYSEQELRSSLEHHRQIHQAIGLRDRNLAEQAMRTHIMASMVRHKERISKSPAQP